MRSAAGIEVYLYRKRRMYDHIEEHKWILKVRRDRRGQQAAMAG
jgi:hypothetical protein